MTCSKLQLAYCCSKRPRDLLEFFYCKNHATFLANQPTSCCYQTWEIYWSSTWLLNALSLSCKAVAMLWKKQCLLAAIKCSAELSSKTHHQLEMFHLSRLPNTFRPIMGDSQTAQQSCLLHIAL